MKIDRRTLIAGGAAVAATAALPARATPADAAALRVLDDTAEALLVEYPENAAYLGIDTGARAALKSTLMRYGKAAVAARAAACDVRLARLKAIDRSALSPDVAIDCDVAQAAHQLAADGYRRMPVGDVAILSASGYRSTPYAVSQGTGAFAEVPTLLVEKHGVATAGDADAYLARMQAYAAALDAETATVAADAAAGVILPGFLNDITTRQLKAGAAQPVAQWDIVTSFATKLAKAGLPATYRDRAERLAATAIAPAIARQADQFVALRPKAGDAPGMWAQPDAADRYQWLVEAGTTTTRTPDQIHASGLDQCRAFAAQMDPLLRAAGLTQGTAGERMAVLGKRADMLFPDTDAGRAEILAFLERGLADVRTRLPRAFGKLVPGHARIQRVPPAIEAGAPNGYAGAGTKDGKTPGIFYINLKDTGIWPRFALPTLSFHEAIPGHIWQGEYLFDLRLVRSLLSFNAYSEGWALYAEQLADELGVYADNPIGRLGYLQSMNFRAARLVADTGLHAKRWTFAQAVAFFMETTGFTQSQARSELQRYCAWPGQALGYKTGHNEINRLRDKAKAALGAKFDVRRFDDRVVTAGGMPLGVLERVVDRWVAGQA